MNVLWIKDNNIGHEKQVQVLLDELSNNLNLNIECRTVKGSIPFFRYIDKVQENFYDLIIGAGHKTYPILIKTKKNQKRSCKNIAVLAPSSNLMKFDVICAPSHDAKRLKTANNVIFYEGSLAKVSTDDVDEKIGVIAIGGINNHYHFDEDHIISQIKYFVSLHPNKHFYIFNSRRTPISMNNKIELLVNNNLDYCDVGMKSPSLESVLHKASVKLITKDSMNMVYESLSCRGNTYLLDMNFKKLDDKVVLHIEKLIKDKYVGYIELSNLVDEISTMQIKTQNIYNDVFAEVEKVSFELCKLL